MKRMHFKLPKIHIGLRTIKTALAVSISLIVTERLGTTDSRMIFAMLGAMSAVQPSFKESIEACFSQIIGVVFGAVCSVLMFALALPPLVEVGAGIILVITLYNILQIRYSPSLPCFVLVLACTTPDIEPFSYAVGRIWDTAIGLAIGMAVDMLVFPYDNSCQIRQTAGSLERSLLLFLEELFDGDDILPDLRQMRKGIATLEKQLKLFSNQKFLLRHRSRGEELAVFRACEEKAQALISHMEILCSVGAPGALNPENRTELEHCGARIRDLRQWDPAAELDVVTNYHVARILALRQELLEVLGHG